MAILRVEVWVASRLGVIASNPGSHPAFCRLQYEKLDESLGSRLGKMMRLESIKVKLACRTEPQ